MAENTLQYRWIVRLVSNLQRLLQDQVAFVAGDLLWYPVEVDQPPVPSIAPDALVVLGRPAGDRGSYKQWQEEDMAPQVVFEIISPSNTIKEMLEKQKFYGQYGVLEAFFYNPETQDFMGLVRATPQDTFTLLMALELPWTSPTLGIRFELGAELEVFYPNGEKFKDPIEFAQERDQFAQERDQFAQERDQFAQERDRAFAKLREMGIDPKDL
ncbi:MAG: Uma2 family endonuclease [Prochlorothrix sp.]